MDDNFYFAGVLVGFIVLCIHWFLLKHSSKYSDWFAKRKKKDENEIAFLWFVRLVVICAFVGFIYSFFVQ